MTRAAASLLCLLIALPGTVALPQGEQLPDVIRRVKPSIVAVGLVGALAPPRLAGTGFVVGDGRHVLTCQHVVTPLLARGPERKLAVFVGSGADAKARLAHVVATDPEHDAALLRFEGEARPALSLAREGDVVEGQAVAFTGYPIAPVYGLNPVTHRGIVSAITPIAIPQRSARLLDGEMIRRLRERPVVYQLDATAYPGNSGSPIYDPKTGVVLAILSSGFVKESKEKLLSDPSGITFAIPIRHARALLAGAEPPE